MIRPARRHNAVRPATATVELVFVLPLLVLLVLGCVDLGRFSHVNITVTNAARTGAEFGSMHPSTPATLDLWEQLIRKAVVDEMAKLDQFDSTRLTVVITTQTDGDTTRVAVEVSYPFETIMDWPGLPARLTLRRVVTMPMTRP
jgi:Flp pilus assembly protein TadG